MRIDYLQYIYLNLTYWSMESSMELSATRLYAFLKSYIIWESRKF